MLERLETVNGLQQVLGSKRVLLRRMGSEWVAALKYCMHVIACANLTFAAGLEMDPNGSDSTAQQSRISIATSTI